MARVRDPFGHLWLLRERAEEDSATEGPSGSEGLPHPSASSKTSPTILGGAALTPAGRLHLVIGPVGAGKSTFVLALCREHRALGLHLDAWMAELFRPDRPETGVVAWYVERAGRCVEQIWKVAARALDAEMSVVLGIGLLRRREREAFYRRAKATGHAPVVYVLDAPREVRRARVERRNLERGATFSMVVPPDVFEMASDMWEPPDEAECSAQDVRNLSGVPGAEPETR